MYAFMILRLDLLFVEVAKIIVYRLRPPPQKKKSSEQNVGSVSNGSQILHCVL